MSYRVVSGRSPTFFYGKLVSCNRKPDRYYTYNVPSIVMHLNYYNAIVVKFIATNTDAMLVENEKKVLKIATTVVQKYFKRNMKFVQLNLCL